MMTISEKDWDLVLKKFEEKIQEIENLEKKLSEKNDTIDSLNTDIEMLLVDKEKLEIENKKLKKQYNITDETLKLVLQKLNETNNNVKNMTLVNRNSTVKLYELDMLG